jgi:Fur family ferric uptake transcriptional regulator
MQNTIAKNPNFLKAFQIFEEFIVAKKLRRTPERNYLLELIYNNENHFDVEELYQSLAKDKFHLSKATVYNSLDLFVESGIVIRHYLHNNISIYEKAYGQRQHDHFVCSNCKTIVEFCDPRLYMIKKSLGEILKVKINSHNLYLYGICSNPQCNK